MFYEDFSEDFTYVLNRLSLTENLLTCLYYGQLTRNTMYKNTKIKQRYFFYLILGREKKRSITLAARPPVRFHLYKGYSKFSEF